MDPVTDSQEPDEARPAKRPRLEAPLEITEETQEEIIDDGDWDDIYGLKGDGEVDVDPVREDESVPVKEAAPELGAHQAVPTTSEPARSEAVLMASDMEQDHASVPQEDAQSGAVEDGLPVDAVVNGNELLAQQQTVETSDGPSAKVLEETTQIEAESPYNIESPEEEDAEEDGGVKIDAVAGAESTYNEESGASETLGTNGEVLKAKDDSEFMVAAAAQKDNNQAEWQFDSSDAQSSDSDTDSSSDDDSDDSDSDSEGGYEMLDPATAAKILMSGDGDDDDGEKGKDKSGADHQPRTANERKENIVPKPDVVVTEEMEITYLGTVDRTVDNTVLIKAVTPGEYQVLEYGSVLCTEGREVVGAVADTMGRVQEPIYSVAFTNPEEIEVAGLEYGTKIFYVNSHSTFVFTQPLKNLKGTDASNIHDEEVGEDEMEFSDDEEEAEYKKMRKQAKRDGRGGLSRSAFNEERTARTFGPPGHDSGHTFINGRDAPQQHYGGGLSYGDGDVQDEFYSPLKRPDNLSELMASGGPPRPQFGHFDRGRGRGRGDRGRGRGDRGRGRGGFDHRNQRGRRGGYGQNSSDRGDYGQQSGHRGNAHSFPDRHNEHRSNGYRQNSMPAKPPAPQSSPPPHQAQYPAYQQYQPQQPHSPQSYQFNGYTFQYGNPAPAPAPAQQTPTPQTSYYNQQAQSPGGSIPVGSYVNPAFFQNMQQQQSQWVQPAAQQLQQALYSGWQPQPQQPAQAQYGNAVPQNYSSPAQQQQAPSTPNNNLADILRQLGGGQGR